MNSPTNAIKQDMILEIISHCPAEDIGKFRLVNKECNRRSYEFFFINHHLHRTKSVFGYFIQYRHRFKYRCSSFVSGIEDEAPGKTGISLEFLPSKDVKIEACDTHHGILLCVDDDKYKGRRRIPDFIICKPTTKQYRVIPNPKTRYFTVVTGLMVIQSNPFRYKIVRVSEPMTQERRKTKEGFYNLNCEVFDSDCFAWKRLNDLELPRNEFFTTSAKPVAAYGFLHWLMSSNNVIRFCIRTETWSLFPVPDDLVGNSCLVLVSYEGKLGVVSSNSGEGDNLWVLENSFGKSWVKMKDVKIKGLEDKYVDPLWFPSNDVVSIVGFDRLGLYNMNSEYLHMRRTRDFFFPCYDLARYVCIPFYSNYDRICLKKDESRSKKT